MKKVAGDIITFHICTKNPMCISNAWRYYHFTNVHHKWQSYDVWFLRYGERPRIFCHFRQSFALLPLITIQRIKILKNEKKHMEIISENHMIYGSWDMDCDTKCFVILDHTFLFYPANNSENQNFEKWKKRQGISFYTCAP